MDLQLRGLSALLTGASRGIGLASARALAAEGCHLHIAARDKEKLTHEAEEIRQAYGVDVTTHVCDLSRTAEVEALGRECINVDILVNNAGDIPTGTLAQLNSDVWRRSWDLKVFGYVDLTRIIYEAMKNRGNGVIVNVVGAAGQSPNPQYIAGCMANAALNMFSRCLGGESMRFGIRVVSVDPGPTISDRHLAHVSERAARVLGNADRWPELHAQFPAKRAATVEEVAKVVTFAASACASFISGVSLTVDGGLTSARNRA